MNLYQGNSMRVAALVNGIAELCFDRVDSAINADQNAAFIAFEDLPVPVVTAINGLALGRGLEMALSSDYSASFPASAVRYAWLV